jgi:rubrerythrin
MKQTCVHSCKGLCNALEVAEHREQEAIKEYRQFMTDCDYPDVREILADLVKEREKAVKTLKAKRDILAVKFATLDQVNQSFS